MRSGSRETITEPDRLGHDSFYSELRISLDPCEQRSNVGYRVLSAEAVAE